MREVWFALGLIVATAIPVHFFLIIGPDLAKSLVLYLPSVRYALLAALEHNRLAWCDVTRVRRPASCSQCRINYAAVRISTAVSEGT